MICQGSQRSDKVVYILAANKDFKYQNGRSRIVYIGTTKRVQVGQQLRQ